MRIKLTNQLLSSAIIFLQKWQEKRTQKIDIHPKKNSQFEYAKKQGKLGEQAFIRWSHTHQLPFVFLEQTQHTYNRNTPFKRPDFIVNAGNFAVAVDVKNHQISKCIYQKYKREYACFKLKKSELEGLKHFSEKLSLPVYFAFKGDDCWYWIDLLNYAKYAFNQDDGMCRLGLNRCVKVKDLIGLEMMLTGVKK